LEIVYFALEDQLPRVDDRAAFERAYEELRREFREYWKPRLPPPPAEPTARLPASTQPTPRHRQA
jgi:hypothetical protein